MNSKINKESLLAIFLTDNNYQKIHYYEFPIIKELKWRNGAKTKYEIPQFINDVPEDFPVFCTIKEAGMIKNYQNKMKKKEDKNKKNKSDLKSKEKEKEKEKEKNNNNSKNDNNNILDEPIPNEIHKYCHLCKKHFDNYMRHINTKIHKDNTNKYSDTFKNIKNIFKRINTYWDDKKKNNDNHIKNNNNDNIRNNDEDFEDDNFKFKIFSQFNQNIKEGCKAKKKILIGQNSQLSTAQSFPVIPPKKRKKNDVKNITNKSKDKKNKSNKNINEFLINGEFINIKKLNRNEINFYNNYYN